MCSSSQINTGKAAYGKGCSKTLAVYGRELRGNWLRAILGGYSRIGADSPAAQRSGSILRRSISGRPFAKAPPCLLPLHPSLIDVYHCTGSFFCAECLQRSNAVFSTPDAFMFGVETPRTRKHPKSLSVSDCPRVEGEPAATQEKTALLQKTYEVGRWPSRAIRCRLPAMLLSDLTIVHIAQITKIQKAATMG